MTNTATGPEGANAERKSGDTDTLQETTDLISLKTTNCVKCLTCYSVCPFEAISVKENKIHIDIETCQLCGICASLCPANNIELACYDNKRLVDYVERQMNALQTDNLVVMCRGSSPSSCEMIDIIKENKVSKFIPLRLPCVGRVSPEFYLQILSMGIRKIIVIQCDEDSCRFLEGSSASLKKVSRMQKLLDEMDCESDTLILIESSNKAVYHTDECVGCDKCVFVCPYEAIEAQPLSTPRIDLEKCRGCGMCSLVCPHLAIQLKSFEYDPISRNIQKFKAEADAKVEEGSPQVLVFCCQWAEFSALDQFGEGLVKHNVVIVEIPCYNALDPVQVLEAFYLGFDGVLVITCPEDDCKFGEMRHASKRNYSALEKALKKFGIDDRFEITTLSPKSSGHFNSRVDTFIAKILKLHELNRGR